MPSYSFQLQDSEALLFNVAKSLYPEMSVREFIMHMLKNQGAPVKQELTLQTSIQNVYLIRKEKKYHMLSIHVRMKVGSISFDLKGVTGRYDPVEYTLFCYFTPLPGIDLKTGKKVSYPVFTFDDKEYQTSILKRLSTQILKWISEENPIIALPSIAKKPVFPSKFKKPFKPKSGNNKFFQKKKFNA